MNQPRTRKSFGYPCVQLVQAIVFGVTLLWPLTSYSANRPRLSTLVAQDNTVTVVIRVSKGQKRLKSARLVLERACDYQHYRSIFGRRSPYPLEIVVDKPIGFDICSYRATLTVNGRTKRVKLRSGVSEAELFGSSVVGPNPDPTPRAMPTPARLKPGQTACDQSLLTAMTNRINFHRTRSGLTSLSNDYILSVGAMLQSIKMAWTQNMTHTGWSETLMALGFSGSYMSQNIAYFIASPAEVVDLWMQSPGHRENILSTRPTWVGIGCVRDSAGVPWWAADFGGN